MGRVVPCICSAANMGQLLAIPTPHSPLPPKPVLDSAACWPASTAGAPRSPLSLTPPPRRQQPPAPSSDWQGAGEVLAAGSPAASSGAQSKPREAPVAPLRWLAHPTVGSELPRRYPRCEDQPGRAAARHCFRPPLRPSPLQARHGGWPAAGGGGLCAGAHRAGDGGEEEHHAADRDCT